MNANDLIKFPRTPHIESSGLQKGDEDLDIMPFWKLRGKILVVESKIDGANTGISFSEDGDLRIQSRGHYLVGGDWPEFDQFKTWSNTFQSELFDILENRYIMYGEWMAAFHSVYYNNLPHFFMEFDIYDKKEKVFLDTARRNELTGKCAVKIESVRVIQTNKFHSLEDLLALVGKSTFITDDAIDEIPVIAKTAGLSDDEIKLLIDLNKGGIMEGLYIKSEQDGIVKERYKYVRPGFVQTILDYGKHWTDRPTIPNKLANGRNLFEMRQ